jgi:ATP-dependent DNA helicase RecG
VLSDAEIEADFRVLESDRIERKASAADGSKIRDMICALANDMPDHRRSGVIFIGQNDDLSCAGLNITDELLLRISGWCTDGSVIPPPATTVKTIEVDGCRLIAVIVEPSINPPVRHSGAIRIRVGPMRALATPEQERRLIEKRRWGLLPFDQFEVPLSTVNDLDLVRFENEFLPAMVSVETLRQNGRDRAQKLLATRVTRPDGTPTVAGMLALGNEPRAYFPGAFIAWRRVDGTNITNETSDEKEIGGTLIDQARRIDEIMDAVNNESLTLGENAHVRASLYPRVALQQLIRNALFHRNYEATNSPVRVTWYSDRIEILSPGGPYCSVTAQNFGTPGLVDYRNPTIAGYFKGYGLVERFGFGIEIARRSLEAAGSAPPEFAVLDNFINVVVRRRQ